MHLTGTRIQPSAVKDILSGILFCMLIIIIMHIMPMVGIFAWMFLPLPILFYRLKAGRTGGMIIMTVCLGVLIGFTGNAAFNLIYFGFFLLTGFFLGEFIEKMMGIEKIMLCSCSAVLGIAGGIFFIYSLSLNMDIGRLISSYLDAYQAFSTQLFSETAKFYPQMDVDIKRLEKINAVFITVLPAVFINSYLTMMWINILSIRKLLRKNGIVIKNLENLNHWKAPDYLVAAVIASSVVVFLPVGFFKLAAVNCLFVLMFVYLLQGISVASFFFEKKRAPIVLKIFFYVLIAIQPLFMFLVVGFGLFDTWFNFRKLDTAT